MLLLQYFQPALSYHLSLRPLFRLFLSGGLRQALLYMVCTQITLNLFQSGYLQTGILANSEDQDVYCLIGSALFAKIKINLHGIHHHHTEISISDSSKYKNGQINTNSINMHGKIQQNEKKPTRLDKQKFSS